MKRFEMLFMSSKYFPDYSFTRKVGTPRNLQRSISQIYLANICNLPNSKQFHVIVALKIVINPKKENTVLYITDILHISGEDIKNSHVHYNAIYTCRNNVWNQAIPSVAM